jgi:predicted neutral ceramidase superfamily lipid hydrolase
MNLMNCEEIMRNLLLNQNGLYRIKWPLAILVSVIAINVLLNSKTKIESWYIYVIALIVSFIVILLCNIFANASVSSSELASLVRKCTNCNLDQTGKMENFENMEEEQVSDDSNNMEIWKKQII